MTKGFKYIVMAAIILASAIIPAIQALPEIPSVVVPETGNTISVDGVLDMISEWNDSVVVPWYNPLGAIELDRVYLLHNATHYFVGAVLYDPDHKTSDDTFYVYVSFGSEVYKYVLDEGSNTVYLYDVTSSPVAISTNATAVVTHTDHWTHWIYVEMAVPKSEWDNSANVKMYFEHEHTFKVTVISRYPEGANATDTSKWLNVYFKSVLGQYSLSILFLDRDNNTIEYVANMSYAVIKFSSNGTIYTVLSLNNSYLNVSLPPDTYTIDFYVYDIKIFSTEVSVSDNVSLSITLNNLKHVSTPIGNITAFVEWDGDIGGIYLDPENHIGVMISNSSFPVALRIYSNIDWNYTFVTVINALNFTYNPFTRNLFAYSFGNFSGITIIGAPSDYPVFFMANGTIKGYVYNHELKELCAWISAGLYRVYYDTEPFAVTLNNTALKKGVHYFVDPFNVTVINMTTGGDLRIYYKNPCKVEARITGNNVYVSVATPYVFSGNYTIVVKRGDLVVKTIHKNFTADTPLTTIEEALDLPAGTYDVEVVVNDSDSNQTVGATTLSYEVSQQPSATPIEVPWNFLLFILVILALILSIIAVTRRAKHVILEEQSRKFVRKR